MTQGRSRRNRRLVRAVVAALLGLFALAALAVVAVPGAEAEPPPALAVTGASLTVASTGQRLDGVNADKQLLIASTTKLMTALVVLQHVKNLSETFTDPDWEAASVDSQIGLEPGERMSVRDLMLALLLPSADDAAHDLADNVGGGSVTRFVAEMNADARALGLTHTHYSNPIGLDSAENYSSPYDLTRLAAYLLAHYPFFARTVRLTQAKLTTGNYVRHITNTDTLLGTEPWVTGVKTGHTDAAGYILVSSGTRHGLTLIASVLGTTSEAARNANALALLDYGFSEFRQVNPVRRGEVIRRLAVSGEGTKAVVIAQRGFQDVVPKRDRVSVVVKLPQQLTGPLAAHATVGSEVVWVNRAVVATIPVILGRPVPAESMLAKLAHVIGGSTTLGLLALMLGVTITVAGLRRRPLGPVPRRRAELETR